MGRLHDRNDDRPLPQSRPGMSPKAWLAGEPIDALAAEYGVKRLTIHRNACLLKMRKTGRLDAVRLAKGPALAVVEVQASHGQTVTAS